MASCQAERAAAVAKLEASVQSLETTVASQGAELSTLKVIKCLSSFSLLSHSTAIQASGEDSHRGLEEQLAQTHSTVAQLEAQLADSSTQQQALTTERDAAKARSKQVEQDLEALHGDLQTLQTEAIESREEAQRRRGQLDELALERDRQVGEHQDKMSILQAAQAEVVAGLEAKVVEVESLLATARDEQHRVETEANTLREQVAALEAELVTVREAKNTCSQQLQQEQTSHAELQVPSRLSHFACFALSLGCLPG